MFVTAIATWKKNLARFATNERGREAHPDRRGAGLVDIKARVQRITARVAAEAEEADVQFSIARLVSASGGTEWEYDVKAGVVTVT